MRIDDLFLAEDQHLEEGPVWDKTRQVGAAVGKGLGAVGQGIGAVAGVPAGIARSIKKGYNRAADTIAGGPDETPAQASAPAQGAAQPAQGGFAQAMQQATGGGSAGGDAAGLSKQLRQKAEQLIKAAEELEKQAQAQMSSQQQGGAQQQAPASTAAPTQSAPQQQAPAQQQEPAQWPAGVPKFNSVTGQKFTSPEEAQKVTSSPEFKQQMADIAAGKDPGGVQAANQQSLPAPTQQAPAEPTANVSTPSSTGGQISQTSTGQVHRANPNNPNQPAPAPVAGQPPDLKLIPGGKGTATDPNNIAARKAALAQAKADRQAGKGVTGAIRTGTLGEGAEFYSKFFKKMI